MGKLAVVFAGGNSLDRLTVRLNVVRIPVVSIRLREAQSVIEAKGISGFDLTAHMTSDDSVFLRNPKLKALCASIVQVGLFDRVKKSGTAVDLFVGVKAQDSAMKVASGKVDLKTLVSESAAFQVEENTVAVISAPLLSSVAATQMEVVAADGSEIAFGTTSAKEVLMALASQKGVTNFLNIGPVPLISMSEQEAILGADAVEESIERDPLLSWFWSDLGKVVAV